MVEVVTGHHGHELQPGRHRCLHLLKRLVDGGIHLSGISTRCREHHAEGTRLVLDVRGEVVTHGTNLHLGHVAQVQHTTATGAQHDVIELLDGLQCTLVLHGVLVGVLRQFAQGTHTSHETLSADGVEDVVRSQVVLCHHIRLQPDTQSIGVTQALNVTHTGDTHQFRLDVDVDIVRHEVLVVLAVSTLHGKNAQNVVLSLLHLHTDLGHIGRQQGLGAGDAILHIHRRHVGVGALLEIDVDLHLTVRRGLGSHVSHVVHTVDGLLQRLDDRLHHRVLVSTGVTGADIHRRRCNIRILLNPPVLSLSRWHTPSRIY